MIVRLLTSRAVVVVTAALLGGALAGWLTWPSSPPRADALPALGPSPTSTGSGTAPPAALRTARRAGGSSPAPAGERPAGRGGKPERADGSPDRPGAREAADRGRTASRRPRVPAPAVPRVLRVPSFDLVLPVRPQGVDRAGAMALPDTVDAVGWYRYSPRPGSASGASVLAGHVDTAAEGIGPLASLADLEVGRTVFVDSARGTVAYEVRSVSSIERGDLDLERLFARDGRARLHLVTCSGEYLPEQGGYQSNLVVVATPTGGPTSIASGG